MPTLSCLDLTYYTPYGRRKKEYESMRSEAHVEVKRNATCEDGVVKGQEVCMLM